MGLHKKYTEMQSAVSPDSCFERVLVSVLRDYEVIEPQHLAEDIEKSLHAWNLKLDRVCVDPNEKIHGSDELLLLHQTALFRFFPHQWDSSKAEEQLGLSFDIRGDFL